MPMQDLRTHLDKYFAVLPMLNVGKSAGTLCDKRRAIEFVTSDVTAVTCQECITAGRVELNKWIESSIRLLEIARENQDEERVVIANVALARLREKLDVLPGSITL